MAKTKNGIKVVPFSKLQTTETNPHHKAIFEIIAKRESAGKRLTTLQKLTVVKKDCRFPDSLSSNLKHGGFDTPLRGTQPPLFSLSN